MKFKISNDCAAIKISNHPTAISDNNSDSHLVLVSNKGLGSSSFGHMEYKFRDHYLLNDGDPGGYHVLELLNRSIKSLDDKEQQSLYRKYLNIREIINLTSDTTKISDDLHTILQALSFIKTENILSTTDVSNALLLYHAAHSDLKELVSKEQYLDIIRLGVILKAILPIVNYYHYKWAHIKTISIYLLLQDILKSLPGITSSLNIIRNIVKVNCPNDIYDTFCLLIEENIYLDCMPYYDVSFLNENNNLLNIIKEHILDELTVLNKLHLNITEGSEVK